VRLGLSDATISMKLSGQRPWFPDEVEVITATINETGRMSVTRRQVAKLIGRDNLQIVRRTGHGAVPKAIREESAE